MDRLKSFFLLTLFGGLAVVLPITIFFFLVRWLVGVIGNVIAPISNWLASWFTVSESLADLLVIIFILSTCFSIGLLIKTSVGRWLHIKVDAVLSRLAPGYSTIREMVTQIIGGEGNNASLLNGKVCRAYIMGRNVPASVTAIITAEHEDGTCTVYVPTAPIPTSGLVYHLPADCIEYLDASVEAAMRTVVACGSGSQFILATKLPEQATQ
ncbi:MAG TPA: DUF502 domain-containing protein [Cellvibrionaceae bacterium]